MAQMASGAIKFATGVIEPSEELTTINISVPFNPTMFTIIVTNKSLESGKRQFIGYNHVVYNGYFYGLGIASNSSGTSIASPTVWTENTQENPCATIENGIVSINLPRIASLCRVLVGKTYRWFAYA